MIFLERGGELSGQIIFAQVKCVKAKRCSDGMLSIPISTQQLSRNLAAWRRVVGAAIVILVNPSDLRAWWVNIKPDDATTSAQILVPEDQLFDGGAKSKISQLCGTLNQDLQAQKIHSFAADFLHLRGKDHIQKQARVLFKELESKPTFVGSPSQRAHFDRDGWRHITRPDRSQLSRYQSFVLLGAARKILKNCSEPLADLYNGMTDDKQFNFFQIDSMVTFPFRQTGLVRMVLRKSLHEPQPEQKIEVLDDI